MGYLRQLFQIRKLICYIAPYADESTTNACSPFPSSRFFFSWCRRLAWRLEARVYFGTVVWRILPILYHAPLFHVESMWNRFIPCGIHMDSTWNMFHHINHVLNVDSAWNPHGIHMDLFHMESTWNPHGIHMESTWNPHEVHVDSMWNVPNIFNLFSSQIQNFNFI